MKLLITFFLLTLSSCFSQDTITRIGFGSCEHQDKPTPILNLIPTHHPDLFIFLGDNIYVDSKNMCYMKKQYRKLGKKPEYKKLKESTPIIATWDDHDPRKYF
jgi:alkaline phosphatase D